MRLPLSSRILKRSISTAPAWVRPLAPGVLPAYDEALTYLARDKEAKLAQLEKLKAEGSLGKEELEKLEVLALVNDPEVRWRAKEGLGDLSQPIYRHLAEQAWRRDSLPRLMQRVTQMSVTPDLLASISPNVDLRVIVKEEDIVPGVFLSPSLTKEQVKVTAQVFHPEERLYTLILIDPDVPDEETRSFTTYAHWLHTNIPLSSTSSTVVLSPPHQLLPYIPPHPQQGTPYHRYTLLLLLQPPTSTTSISPPSSREGFSIREFVRENGLEACGVHFWREKWERETVAEIYREFALGMDGTGVEPRFGRERKFDGYKGAAPKYEI